MSTDNQDPTFVGPVHGGEPAQEETIIEAAPDNVTELSQPRRMTKLEQKKARIVEERIARIMNDRKCKRDEAIRVLVQEDFERLPLAEKLKRYEHNLTVSVNGFREDILQLQHNDTILADAMDLNFRAITKVLATLGVTPEQQKAITAQVEEEMKAERDAELERRAAAVAKGIEEKRKRAVAEGIEAAGEPPPPPEGATTFGG